MNRFQKFKQYYNWGGVFLNDPEQIKGEKLNESEAAKKPLRYEVINEILKFKPEATYLEIGVRNPALNFDKIHAKTKYSVDPGLEFKENPVDFKVTSDEFFTQLRQDKILQSDIKFDLVFIDGLHLAEQVDRDIENAFSFLKEDGFIVLHDCNPPSEWHARENHAYRLTPAKNNWNGTTWKAFVKWGQKESIRIACVDSDWGVGVLTKGHTFESSKASETGFYEFAHFEKNKRELINLMPFDQFKSFLKQSIGQN